MDFRLAEAQLTSTIYCGKTYKITVEATVVTIGDREGEYLALRSQVISLETNQVLSHRLKCLKFLPLLKRKINIAERFQLVWEKFGDPKRIPYRRKLRLTLRK